MQKKIMDGKKTLKSTDPLPLKTCKRPKKERQTYPEVVGCERNYLRVFHFVVEEIS